LACWAAYPRTGIILLLNAQDCLIMLQDNNRPQFDSNPVAK
jgi:hypothetical protein